MRVHQVDFPTSVIVKKRKTVLRSFIERIEVDGGAVTVEYHLPETRTAGSHDPAVLSIVPFGGAAGNRTPDLVIANDALSQLSYSPPARTSLLGFPPDTSDIGRAGIEFRTFSA